VNGVSLYVGRMHYNALRKEYSAVVKRYFIGYKLHLLTSQHGVFQYMQITPGVVHDVKCL